MTGGERRTPDPASGSARLVIGPGSRLGGYVLEALLGKGGMGTVWRARDVALGRVVAVKVLPISVRDDRRARSLRELEAASRVKHPNIVDVHAAGEGPGCLYLAMDLVEGATLDAVVARGPLAPRRAATLTLGLSRALAALHAAGVLHRDVKPSNVLLGADDVPRLMDFGIARLRDAETLTKTQQVLGTPMYMAPEQLAGEAVDERADVYGLGAVLYECLTGRPPTEGDTLMALAAAKESPITPPSGHVREVDRALDAVALTALAPLAGRYASAQALGDDLERWLAGEPVVALPRRSTRLVVVGGLLAALLLAGGVAAAVALGRASAPEPLGPALAQERQALEQQAASASSLAGLDVEAARALAARAQGEPEAAAQAEALARWVALVDLARSGGAPPVPAASERGPAAQALRGALLRATEPAAALAALEQAQRGGLDVVEVQRWRLEALAARGVETKAEAAARLKELAAGALAALDPAVAARLEVSCLVALGRLREARGALARAGPAPVEAWALAVAEARALLGEGQPARAWAALEPTPRPPGPVRPAEADLAARALEAATRVLAERVRATSPLRDEAEVALVTGALELHVRALPAPAPPPELRDLAAQVVVQTCALSNSPPLVLAVAGLFPDDAEMQVNLAVWFAIGSEEVTTSERVVALARLNLTRCRPQDAPIHGLALARHLLAFGRLDEAGRALDAVDAGAAKEDQRELAAETALILRCMLLRARGEFAAALALLDEGDRRQLKQVTPEERLGHRLATLSAAGRRPEALQVALRYMVERPATNGHMRVAILGACWDLCLEAGKLDELRTFAEALVKEFDLDGLWHLRLAWLRGTLGDPAGSAEAYERSGGHALTGGPALAARLRAGDPDALAQLLAQSDITGAQNRERMWRSSLDVHEARR